jgi:hypothetical protein
MVAHLIDGRRERQLTHELRAPAHSVERRAVELRKIVARPDDGDEQIAGVADEPGQSERQ